jgi:hypothetical protein
MKRSDGEIHSLLCELTLMMSAATATFFLNLVSFKQSQSVRTRHTRQRTRKYTSHFIRISFQSSLDYS